MHDYRVSVKITLVITYISMILLVAFAVFLPFLVTEYVEIRHKSATLATTIMVTCYPCIPFAAATLISLRGLLKNALAGLILGDQNNKHLKIIAVCCLCAAIIMILGGFSYMPFLISGAAALIGALIIWTVRSVFDSALQMQREKDFKSVRLFYEEDDNIGDR